MSDKHHGNPVATYIITALILGVITYFEFAIVEYEIAWLSRAATIFWLVSLSVIKFIMVVAIFMHLKDDERTYTGFFGSGMLIALATFVILPILFTVGSFPQGAQAETESQHEEAEAGLDAETRELIESDGYSRSSREQLDTPRPADRSLTVEPPAASEPRAGLRQAAPEDTADEDGDASQEAAEAEATTDEAEAAGAEQQAEDPQAEDQQTEDQGAEEQTQAAATQPEQPEQAGALEFDRELGESVYASNCQGCHQAQGAGVPGVFPPLAGNLPLLVSPEGGREYLIDVVLHGLSGPIEVNGQTYNGAMPPWAGSLSDEQIAAVLNYSLTAWGNDAELQEFSPIEPDEVATNREEDPGNLNERRAELQPQ